MKYMTFDCKECKTTTTGKRNPGNTTGYFCSKSCGLKFRNRLPKYKKINSESKEGEKCYGWSKTPSYRAIHGWIKKRFGVAKNCSACGMNEEIAGGRRQYQWSNISGEYLRDVTDWWQLCVICHKIFDSSSYISPVRPRRMNPFREARLKHLSQLI